MRFAMSVPMPGWPVSSGRDDTRIYRRVLRRTVNCGISYGCGKGSGSWPG